jgi:bacteriorhodopsin
MKLIGFPLYAYSVVIFTMLLAAGLGSLSADRFDISPKRHWALPFIGVLLCGGVLWLIYPPVFGLFLAAPLAVRILVGAAMIFPMGFFMGMPLPLGILALADRPRGSVAWAWAMNGLFTVIGGLIAAIGSIYLGFKVLLLIGFAIYVAAGIAFLRLHLNLAASALRDEQSSLGSVKPA